jgi:hypothetical protein
MDMTAIRQFSAYYSSFILLGSCFLAEDCRRRSNRGWAGFAQVIFFHLRQEADSRGKPD